MDQPYFFFRNKRFTGLIGESGKYNHFFGHSDALVIQGAPSEGELHQLVSLDLRDPSLGLQIEGISSLPLLYCFRFQSGQLEYELLADNLIKITELDEESFDARWPYADYPKRFPQIPLSIGESTECTLKDFEKDVWQGISTSEAEKFICIVPPSSRYTVHLWEKESDFDHISIKFFVDPLKRKVVVYNECD